MRVCFGVHVCFSFLENIFKENIREINMVQNKKDIRYNVLIYLSPTLLVLKRSTTSLQDNKVSKKKLQKHAPPF